MLAIIVLVLAAIAALTVLGFVLHILFSPWILLAIAFTTMAVVALVRAVLVRSRARERTGEGSAIIDGQSTTLRGSEDLVGKKRSSSPFSHGKP